MENQTRTFAKIGALLIINILIVSSATVAASPLQKTLFSSTPKTMTLSNYSRAETELKYYNEPNLSTLIGTQGESRSWQSAIRLTQTEMALYMDWTLTKVNVAFNADHGCPSMTVRIYVYGEGTDVHPGLLLVNDTTYTYHSTGVTTIPLITPVNLTGHQELWIAVEWNEVEHNPGVYYAWLDTLSGPAFDKKGDWYHLSSYWGEMQHLGGDFDGNWGIGGIIEGNNYVELSLGNIEGPLGLKATLQNIGTITANDIRWSIMISGGLHHRIYVNTTGRLTYLDAGDFIPLEVGIFFGLGKITIELKAKADNALEVSVEKYAFLLGPFVVGIR